MDSTADTSAAQPDVRARLKEIAAARADEPRAVVAALEAGIPQSQIAADLDRQREFVRRIARAHGLGSDRTSSTAISWTASTSSTEDAQAIAGHLRTLPTEADGAAYLDQLQLTRGHLLDVATALGLTRVERLSATALRARVLKQAIGARNKFAGLQDW